VVEEETGKVLVLPPIETATTGDVETADATTSGVETDGQRLVARDSDNVPLLSAFSWTDDAAARVLRVPAGLMRDRTQERVETLARERRAKQVDLRLVEEGISLGRKMMEEFLTRYESEAAAAAAMEIAAKAPAAEAAAAPAPAVSKCPFHALAAAGEGGEKVRKAAGLYLNEVGLMSTLEQQRESSRPSGGNDN
jgi:hypothetical protein